MGRELLGLHTDEADPEKAANQSQKKKRIEALRAACSHWVANDLPKQLEIRTRAELGADGWRYSVDETDDTGLTFSFGHPKAKSSSFSPSIEPRAPVFEVRSKAAN